MQLSDDGLYLYYENIVEVCGKSPHCPCNISLGYYLNIVLAADRKHRVILNTG